MVKYITTPHLPKGKVGSAAIGERYRARLEAPLRALGIVPLWIPDAPNVDPRLAGHADLSLIHMGGDIVVCAGNDAIVNSLTNRGYKVIRAQAPGAEYPQDCALNACIVGNRLFHRLDVTAKEVIGAAGQLELINIAQGYAKCCICVVDENSIITSDKGIARAAAKHGVDALEITPGYIELDGFEYGFIGGASFKLSENEMAFTGRLDTHPDYYNIKHFLESRGISIVTLTDAPAFDVGSILPLTEK